MRLHAPWVRRVSILVLYIRRGSASQIFMRNPIFDIDKFVIMLFVEGVNG